MAFNIDPATGKIITVIVIAVIFGIIIVFVAKSFGSTCTQDMTYDTTLKKCRVKCKEGETYYDDIGKCLVCPQGQSMRGGKCLNDCITGTQPCGDKCYNPLIETCMSDSDSSVCVTDLVCEDPKICCGEGKRCDRITDPTKSTCVACPQEKDMCGSTCCDPEKQCYLGVCCDPKKQCGKTGCCQTECCGTGDTARCCNSDINEQCVDGECKVKCGDIYCDSKDLCQKITDINGNVTQGCKTPSGCNWGTIAYQPGNLGEYDDTVVCRDDSGHLIISQDPLYSTSPYSRTVSSNEEHLGTCSAGDCYNRLNETMLRLNSWDEQSGTCTGSFDCGSLPLRDKTTCNLGKSCCHDGEGNLSGQVCAENETCFYDNGNNKCGYGYRAVQDTSKDIDYKICTVSSDPRPDGLYTDLDKCNAALPSICNIKTINPPKKAGDTPTAIICENKRQDKNGDFCQPGLCYTPYKEDGWWTSYCETPRVPTVVKTTADFKFNKGAQDYSKRLFGDAFNLGPNICPKGSYYYDSDGSTGLPKTAICSKSLENMSEMLNKYVKEGMSERDYIVKETC